MKPILQYLSGGSMASLFVDYEPFQGVERSSATSAALAQLAAAKESSGEKSSGKAGLKDLLGLLKEIKALPVDLDALSGHISLLYTEATLFGNEMSQGDLVSTYLSALRLIGRASYNLQEYNEAKKEATANGGINEVAIDLRGHIFVLNQETGEILTVTPLEYGDLMQQGNYQALTNSNLLYLRGNDPNFAFKNDILTTVLNGIGIDKVTLMIMEIKNKIGETSLQLEGYSRQTAQQIMSGMQQLQKAQESGMTIEGLYHLSLITESQLAEAQKALTYIWNTLPKNAKTRLMVASAEMGNENVELGAYNLIGTLIESGLKTVRKYSVDLVKDPSSSGGSGSSDSSSGGDGGDAKGKELDAVAGFALGMGEIVMTNINPGSSYQSTHFARKSIVTDHSGKPLGQYSTLKDVSDGAFAATLDFNNMTFGGARISSYNRAFLENAAIYRMDLPIDVEYKRKTGMLRPDLRLAKKLEALDAAIQRKEIDPNNAEQVNAKCTELGLPPKYVGTFVDNNGQVHLQLNDIAYASFGVMDCLVDENAFEDKDMLDKSLVREVTGTRRDSFKEYMKTADKNYNLDEDFWFFGGGDDLYEGKVFIPATSDPIAASYGGKHYKLPQDNAIQVAQKYADDQARQKFNKALPLSSYN